MQAALQTVRGLLHLNYRWATDFPEGPHEKL